MKVEISDELNESSRKVRRYEVAKSFIRIPHKKVKFRTVCTEDLRLKEF